jgi:hypothetical protein
MLLAGCAYLTSDENWQVVERGYALGRAPYGNEFSMQVHVNELAAVGGDVHGPRFALYVGERLRRNGLCPEGWQFLECTVDESCLLRSANAVKLFGRCLGQAHLLMPPQ